MCVCMAKSMRTWIEEMKIALLDAGHKKDIPIDVFRREFMIISGYKRETTIQWINDFVFLNLISIDEDGKVNFI